ncbi:MAG: alpha/beta hydrolase [Rhodospirillaceae bacterium]
MLMIDKPVCLTDRLGALHGSLVIPGNNARGDAILIWSGTGPTDRDGNGPSLHNNSIKMLAHALGEAGFYVLRTDKRGIAESKSAMEDEAQITFETFVEDCCCWARNLKNEVNPNKIYLIGHSEGALVATLAAQQMKFDALVLLAGIGMKPAELLRRQLGGDQINLTADDLKKIFEIILSLENGKKIENIEQDLMEQFRPSVQPYLISWFKYDPALELSKIEIPTLVIHGTQDLQVSGENAERLAAAKTDAELFWIPNMNHVLKHASKDPRQNYGTYNKPLLPLADGLLPKISQFLKKE